MIQFNRTDAGDDPSYHDKEVESVRNGVKTIHKDRVLRLHPDLWPEVYRRDVERLLLEIDLLKGRG